MRAALGASRFRIVRQSLTESVLLSLFGGMAGLAMAFIGAPFLLEAAPQGLPRIEEISLDARVLGFTLLTAVLSGILFGLAPALRSSNTLLAGGLRESGQRLVRGHQRVRDLLVASEIALALALVTGGALMIRTIAKLSGVDPGFDPHNVLAFAVAMAPGQERTPESVRRASTSILNRIRLISGIDAAASGDDLPMSGDEDDRPIWIEGTPRPKSINDAPFILLYETTPDYLRVMKIPLIRGRFFTEHDNEHSPRVAVIDQGMARKLFAGQDPIGRQLTILGPGYDVPSEIIGIVGSVKHFGLDGRSNGRILDGLYIPQTQDLLIASFGASEIIVRTRSNPLGLMEAIRKQITQENPDQIVWGFHTMDELISGTLAQRRFVTLLLGIFAGVALLLASVGIFGVVAYSVVQRTQEIGIRVALGSKPRDVLKLIVGRGAAVTAIGVAAGIALALFATRSMSSLLYGVSPTDPLVFAVVSLVLTVVALLAAYLPARRASRIDPAVALRYE